MFKYLNSILEDFQKLPNQDLICNFIISNRNQIDNYSNIYGLMLLEQFLEKKWESINEKEKINFLEFLTKILINDVDLSILLYRFCSLPLIMN